MQAQPKEPPKQKPKRVKRVKPLKPLFLFTRPEEGTSVEEVSTSEQADQSTTSLTDLPNEILVRFRKFELIIYSIYFKVRILGYVSFEDLYSLERVSKPCRNAVWKCGWPMRDSLSFGAIIENSDYPNLEAIEKSSNEIVKWKARHKVSDKSVSFNLLGSLFNKKFRSKLFYHVSM